MANALSNYWAGRDVCLSNLHFTLRGHAKRLTSVSLKRRLIMSDLAILAKHLVKEAVHPRLHHKDLREYLDDVDRDVFDETHNYNYTKYISKLYDLL